MIATATVTDTHIVCHVPPRMKNMIAEIPGSRFKPRTQDEWTLPRTFNAAVQLIAQFGFDHLELSPEFMTQVTVWKASESRSEALREAALTPGAWQPRGWLYGYQVPAVDYLREVGSAVLGDDPGTGKTAMSSAWIEGGPTLIVCPKGVQQQWAKELQMFRPNLRPTVLKGSAPQRRKILAAFDGTQGDVLIVTYDQLPIHSRLAPYGAVKLTEDQKTDKELNAVPWVNIIADEAHRAFNPTTRWTRALWWLCERAQRRLIMTGTPSENSPLDFWALLHAAAPDEWSTRSKAQSYYMLSSPGFFGGVEVTGLRYDRREEWDRLVARRFLRRPKELVLPFLPAKVYTARTVEMPAKIRAQYKELKQEMMAELDGGTMMVRNRAVLHMRLGQAASATLTVTGYEDREYVTESGAVEVRSEPIIRLAEPSPKVDAVVDVLSDLGAEPVLILGKSRQLLELVRARLTKNDVPHAAIFGGMRPDEIEHAKEEFNFGVVDILLLSVSSAAEGLSLTRGSTIIRLDRSPKRRENIQAVDRMHGTGRGDQSATHLRIIDLVTEGSVEETQFDTLEDKDAGAEELFRDQDAIRRALS